MLLFMTGIAPRCRQDVTTDRARMYGGSIHGIDRLDQSRGPIQGIACVVGHIMFAWRSPMSQRPFHFGVSSPRCVRSHRQGRLCWLYAAPLGARGKSAAGASLAVTRRKHSNATDIDDAAVILRVAAGEAAALAEIYDRYASLLMGVGVRMMGVRAEAEDVLHDVFVEVWKRAADFDAARGSVRGWLALRMRSRCLDRKKSPRTSKSVSFDEAGMERLPAPTIDPLAQMERRRVREALTTLGPEHRAVVDLAYFVGLSTVEISLKLDIPQGTVKSRLFVAREKLARALGDQEVPS